MLTQPHRANIVCYTLLASSVVVCPCFFGGFHANGRHFLPCYCPLHSRWPSQVAAIEMHTKPGRHSFVISKRTLYEQMLTQATAERRASNTGFIERSCSNIRCIAHCHPFTYCSNFSGRLFFQGVQTGHLLLN